MWTAHSNSGYACRLFLGRNGRRILVQRPSLAARSPSPVRSPSPERLGYEPRSEPPPRARPSLTAGSMGPAVTEPFPVNLDKRPETVEGLSSVTHDRATGAGAARCAASCLCGRWTRLIAAGAREQAATGAQAAASGSAAHAQRGRCVAQQLAGARTAAERLLGPSGRSRARL